MADTRQRTTLGTRFRFLIRAMGLTGLMAVAVGAALLLTVFPAAAQWTPENLRAASDGTHGNFGKAAALTLAMGIVAVVAALVVEVLGGLFLMTGRRTVAGTSATLCTVSAIALLIFVNAYSFEHHKRFDFTRDRQFTLPENVVGKLRTLRSDVPTTIVVLQMHRTFGNVSDKRDSYTKAAEEKVTEKVKDLVDLFREFGPRFKVEVLDTEAFEYDRQLAAVTQGAPELRAAIEAAPENSIFSHANKRVQRLAFNDFLQLDKTASKESHGGRGNLVLLPQGIERFAGRVMNVQERRPKVAICVVGEWLTPADTEGQERTSMAGLKATLANHGFDVVEIVLKENWPRARRLQDLKPTAFTLQEGVLERLEGELNRARAGKRAALAQVAILAAVRKDVDESATAPVGERLRLMAEVSRAAEFYRWGEVTEAIQKWAEANGGPALNEAKEPGLRTVLVAALTTQAAQADEAVKKAEKARKEANDRVEAASQDGRVTKKQDIDVKADFTRLLADVDLLIVPRFTLVNPVTPDGLWPPIHALDKTHVEVIKNFMKSGKPVLACLGPVNWNDGPDVRAEDGFEKLLAERGIELGRETVLFMGEERAFEDQLAGALGGGGQAEIPPVVVQGDRPDSGKAKPNPVGAAVRLTARSADQKLDLRVRAPRPVYLTRGMQDRLSFAAEFVFTSPEAWNEVKPFPTRNEDGDVTGIPHFEPTLRTDKKWNTRAAERKEAFPIGVAIEGQIPAAWVNPNYGAELILPVGPAEGLTSAAATAAATKFDRPTQRLVVFGSGNLFSGATLDPAHEKLLLHSVNWLTNRDDRLPRADISAWQFPRVQMSDREKTLWQLGTAIGLPLVVVYIGVMVTMFRRLR